MIKVNIFRYQKIKQLLFFLIKKKKVIGIHLYSFVPAKRLFSFLCVMQ